VPLLVYLVGQPEKVAIAGSLAVVGGIALAGAIPSALRGGVEWRSVGWFGVPGMLGTVLGALPWYGIGRLVNEQRLERWLERHGRWIGISPQELQRSHTWFNRHGTALVFWGRLIPGIRTLISVPAGSEMMPFVPFLIWTTAGSLIWTLLLTLAGFGLGEAYTNVEVWLDPVAKVIKVVLVLAVLGFGVWLGLRIWKKRQDSH
jgi:membrane protein DedA with SNARE-associated domain